MNYYNFANFLNELIKKKVRKFVKLAICRLE